MENSDRYEQHEMVVKQSYPSGAQEFYCPTCGRRFILQWPPAYQRIILDEGDENAIHSSGSGGLTMQVSSVRQKSEEDSGEQNNGDQTGQIDDPYLSLWSKYLDDHIEL